MVIDFDGGNRRQRIPYQQTRAATPRQKLRITFDLIDERKHPGGGMRNEGGFLNERHVGKWIAGTEFYPSASERHLLR